MKKSEAKYCAEKLYLDEYAGCCGIQIAGGFDVYENDGWHGEKGKTLEQVYNGWLKQIGSERDCRHIQLSFVTKYANAERLGLFDSKEGQCPGFKDFLLKKKWKVVDEFVNPNHGNTVCVMAKTYPKKRASKKPATGLFNYRW